LQAATPASGPIRPRCPFVEEANREAPFQFGRRAGGDYNRDLSVPVGSHIDMPWTFAHPLAVLPLRRYCPAPLNFPALVVGSIIPDLGYHLLRKDLAAYAHSFEGSLFVCLPAGLLLLGLLYLLRKPLWYVLPEPHRSALAPMISARYSLRPATVLAAAISVLLGAWTHIVWDAITHGDGWIAMRVPLLQEPVFQWGGVTFAAYHVLQHLCSYLGVAVLAVCYWRWLHRTPLRGPYFQREDVWRYLLLAAIVVAAALTGATLATIAADRYSGYWALSVFVFRGAVDGVSAFIVLYLLGSVLFYRRRRIV
jgi:hypothetical protein